MLRRSLVSMSMFALASCQVPPPPQATLDVAAVFDGSAGRWVDMSYDYSKETLYWPTADGFQLESVADGFTDLGYYYKANNFTTSEHGGTHLDAPVHFAEGGWSSEQIPLDRLIGAAAVVDVSDRATPDYLVSVEDLTAWEAQHGRIPDGAILLARTGWGSRWPDAAAYLGTDRRGADAVPELHFPGLDPAAARWLVSERAITAFGIDTPSVDYGQSTLFETHQVLYGQNIPGFENVANLDQLPEVGAFVVALPMKIRGGSGGPLRIVAFVPS